MKNRIKAIMLACLLAGTLTGCGASTVQSSDPSASVQTQTGGESDPDVLSVTAQPVSGKEPDETFLSAQTQFALGLMQEAAKADAGMNLLLSPYSVMLALSMTANGAAGDTRTETEQVLGGFPVETLDAYLYSLRTQMPDSEGSRFRTADSLWIRKQGDRIRPKESFLQKNADYFDAEAHMLPFDEAARQKINLWCSEKTDSMIPEILSEPIPEEAVMYLINAVCFDAKWAVPYDEPSTPYDFKATDGTVQQVQMMFSDENKYLSCENACGFLKNYQGNGYAFAAVLPDEGITPEQWLAGMQAEDFREMLTGAESCNVSAGLPEFSCDYTRELSLLLKNMGMRTAFDPTADFSEMAETESELLYISSVLHKTHIDVDTEGTKAAAVTAVEMADECVAEEPEDIRYVILDRPFVYMIVETKTMLPVFIGILNDAG